MCSSTGSWIISLETVSVFLPSVQNPGSFRAVLVQAGNKNKRRNFVPAKIGMIATMIAMVYIPTYNIIISFEVLTMFFK